MKNANANATAIIVAAPTEETRAYALDWKKRMEEDREARKMRLAVQKKEEARRASLSPEERLQEEEAQRLRHAKSAAAVRRPKKKPGLTPAQQAAKKAAKAEESRKLRDSMRMVRGESPLANQAARAKKRK